jgi:hypothetical protein
MIIQHGITGNYYATSLEKSELVVLCSEIGKAESSIKWHKKYNCWVIRVKDKKTKNKLKTILGYK